VPKPCGSLEAFVSIVKFLLIFRKFLKSLLAMRDFFLGDL